MVVSESQSDGRYGPTRLRVQRRTPFSDRRNHVSDAERVKSVCWRGSPDPLQRPRSARLLGEGLAGRFKRSRSLCGRSHRSGRRNRPQRWSSSRLCRVHPALDRVGAREGQLPLPNTPSVADDAGGLKRGCTIGVAAGMTALALTCGCCVTGGPPRTPSTPRPRALSPRAGSRDADLQNSEF